MLSKKNIEIFENKGFSVDYNNEMFQIHKHTNEGVEFTEIFYSLDDFREFVKYYNPEEEVLIYIQDERYKQEIGLKKGLIDFENLKDELKEMEQEII